MRRTYLMWGLVLTACPAVWSAAELRSALRPPAPRQAPAAGAEMMAEALVQARTVADTPAPVPLPAPAPKAPQAGSPARAMVTVDAFREVKGSATQLSGTGVVASRLGHIYVPYFVVRKADALVVTFSTGERAPARLLGGDQESQLAILKVSFVPEGISAPELTDSAGEKSGRSVSMFMPEGRGIRELAGAVVGERSAVGPLRNVLEVSFPAGVEVPGGILTDSRGTLVGLALASARSDLPGRQSVMVLPSSRMRTAIERMVRGAPGTEAPVQANLTVI